MTTRKMLGIRGPNQNLEFKKRYETNPLLEPRELQFNDRLVKVGSQKDLIDPDTGDKVAVNAIYRRRVVDSERYAKIYLEGVTRTFGLSKPAARVFQVILQLCKKDSDQLYLNFMAVQKVEDALQERTYQRGLRELLEAGFIAYSDMPNMFWINVHLFFNGDRVRFIEEYVRVEESKQLQPPLDGG
ncbi:hypothetical protein [Pandoraea communis]|nr:hypothetical protein [Pandoraea communis]